MMKKNLLNEQKKIWITAALLAALTLPVFAQQEEAAMEEKNRKPHEALLRRCRDDILGVRFLCDPEWGLQAEDDALLIVISADPAVTMTVAKIQSPIQYLEQLSSEEFKHLGLYNNNFRKENTKFADRNAVMVKAFAKEVPDMRLLDYFTLHKGELYSVLFSVNPKEKWEDYKFLIKRIGDSFEFLDVEKNNQEARKN